MAQRESQKKTELRIKVEELRRDYLLKEGDARIAERLETESYAKYQEAKKALDHFDEGTMHHE